MAYQNYAVSIAKLLGADPAQAEQQMADMVDFEVQLANVRKTVIQNSDSDV